MYAYLCFLIGKFQLFLHAYWCFFEHKYAYITADFLFLTEVSFTEFNLFGPMFCGILKYLPKKKRTYDLLVFQTGTFFTLTFVSFLLVWQIPFYRFWLGIIQFFIFMIRIRLVWDFSVLIILVPFDSISMLIVTAFQCWLYSRWLLFFFFWTAENEFLWIT